mmetsp:Transcript_56971/g.112469  ORF Transcript_56971/g.112469 Transcript_56971/m.112469 type:complete len:211 (+) Transcript_56971:87-719(+)
MQFLFGSADEEGEGEEERQRKRENDEANRVITELVIQRNALELKLEVCNETIAARDNEIRRLLYVTKLQGVRARAAIKALESVDAMSRLDHRFSSRIETSNDDEDEPRGGCGGEHRQQEEQNNEESLPSRHGPAGHSHLLHHHPADLEVTDEALAEAMEEVQRHEENCQEEAERAAEEIRERCGSLDENWTGYEGYEDQITNPKKNEALS